MKQFLLVLSLFAICSFGKAQSFTVNPGNAISFNAPIGIESDGWIYFVNDRSSDITLVWELESSNMQDTLWKVQVCDNNICYNGLHQGATMAPVIPTRQAFLKFIVTPQFQQTMSGSTTYKVWIENEPSTEVMVTYTVNAVVGIDGTELESSISVYPNPATDVLHLRATNGGLLEKGTAQVYDLAGHLLLSRDIKGLEATSLNVDQLPTGTYLMRYQTKDGIVTKKFVHTN